MPKMLRSRPRSILGAFQTMIFTLHLPPSQARDTTGDQQEGHQKHQTPHRKHGGDKDPQSQRQRADPQAMLSAPSHVVPSSLLRLYPILCPPPRSGDEKKKALPFGRAFSNMAEMY